MLQTIRPNDTGELIKVAQYALNYCKIKKANGIFDEAFTEYVINWQASHSLEADGVIGKNTWKAIANSMPTCSTSKNKISVYTCALQILLGGLTVDGAYGSKTKKAVAAYQSANNLKSDGICGAKTWNALIVGKQETIVPSSSASQVVEGDKVLNNCVKYLQWDKKWKNIKYSTHTSSQTIGNSGCGPTSMAMIMATFIDPKITPVDMAKLSVDNGYRTYDNGTKWEFYKFVFKRYEGFEKFIQTNSVETLKAAIREGALAVCSMNSNDNHFWTKGGRLYKMAPSS